MSRQMSMAAAMPPQAAAAPQRKTIPFDYSFQFALTGVSDTVLNKTVTVSIESTYVAASIGYGFEPEQAAVVFGVRADAKPTTLRALTMDTVLNELAGKLGEAKGTIGPETEAALKNGIRLNADVAALAVLGDGNAKLDSATFAVLFQTVEPDAAQIQFKYALFDEGSGREFQNEPILSTAGLGIADGDRPFRYFAQPIEFGPRSTIRMQVTELSKFKGNLHVVLHGYKVLGGAGTPTGQRGSTATGRGR